MKILHCKDGFVGMPQSAVEARNQSLSNSPRQCTPATADMFYRVPIMQILSFPAIYPSQNNYHLSQPSHNQGDWLGVMVFTSAAKRLRHRDYDETHGCPKRLFMHALERGTCRSLQAEPPQGTRALHKEWQTELLGEAPADGKKSMSSMSFSTQATF
jgi:hypothetical protein